MKITGSSRVTSKNEDEVLAQLLASDAKGSSSGADSEANIVSDVERTISGASSFNSQEHVDIDSLVGRRCLLSVGTSLAGGLYSFCLHLKHFADGSIYFPFFRERQDLLPLRNCVSKLSMRKRSTKF